MCIGFSIAFSKPSVKRDVSKSIYYDFLLEAKSPATSDYQSIVIPEQNDDYKWDLGKVAFSLLPLQYGERRRTLIEEIVKDQIWTLDQVQGIINVNVAVRAVVIKLKEGGLFIYNPVAPTNECIKLVRDLEEKHGKVQHVVLGSLALEHKSMCGPFSRYFPESTVWIQPGQWSFPLDLPTSFLGFPSGDRLKEIPLDNKGTPWETDFDHCVLGPMKFKSVGSFGETAFFHRSTNTLLVTDAVIKVGDSAPPILEEDPRAILYHSRDSALEEIQDTKDTRLRGWKRMTLFSLIFFPSGIAVTNVIKAILDIFKSSPEARLLGEGSVPLSGGLYPWSWVEGEEKSFAALQGGLFVAPILQKIIMNREPNQVLDWADSVSEWDFKRVIPSHMENDVTSTPADFRRAFSFLESDNPPGPKPTEGDFFLLDFVSELFTKIGIIAPVVPPSSVIRPIRPVKGAKNVWSFFSLKSFFDKSKI